MQTLNGDNAAGNMQLREIPIAEFKDNASMIRLHLHLQKQADGVRKQLSLDKEISNAFVNERMKRLFTLL